MMLPFLNCLQASAQMSHGQLSPEVVTVALSAIIKVVMQYAKKAK